MITLKDKTFDIFISREEIEEKVALVAEKINKDYADKPTAPILIAILNGSFVFAADLVRKLSFVHEIHFAKFSSYVGTETTGEVKEMIGIDVDVCGRDVIIVEDIVDTGVTMADVLPRFREQGANSVEVACLLSKPGKLRVKLDIKYCAMEIPNEFIVGYGLDYDGLGRNYPDIYVVQN